jgi:hypothetical protein
MDGSGQERTCIDWVTETEAGILRHQRQQERWCVLQLDGTRIESKQTLFEQINRDLPLDPPGVGPHLKWEALADSLWGGLVDLARDAIAIEWHHARILLVHDHSTMAEALDCFQGLAETLAESRRIFLRIVLIDSEADAQRAIVMP